ncbi:MAG TPA: CHAT domain-containing protein [Candidatus Eisenbacteria bacterium]|nr:CHAT domain-containing protein [Candidatus Eisenbacteria bacterium]
MALHSARTRLLLRLTQASLALLLALPAQAWARSGDRELAEAESLLERHRWEEAARVCDSLIARLEKEPDHRRSLALAEAMDVRIDASRWGGRGHLPEVLALSERALAIREERLRTADPARMASMERLASVRLDRGEAAAAESLLSRAVTLRRGAREPRAYGLALARLADAQRAQRKFDESEKSARLAFATVTGAAAADTAVRVTAKSILGQALSEAGNFDEARRELESALSLASSSAHPDSAQMARTSRHLARVLILEGELEGAGAALSQALAIQERVLGTHHPELAWTDYVATFWTSMRGDFVAGRRHAERALAIREAVYGPDHPLVANALMQLGGAMRNLGDSEGAMQVLQRAVAIQRHAEPPKPADLATALSNLGSVYLVLGEGRRALACFEEAVAIREKVFGPGGGASFWTGTRIGHALLVAGDAAAAQAQIEKTIASPLKRNVFDLADALQIRGCAAYAQSRLAVADSSFDHAYALLDSALGIASPRTLESLGLRTAVRWRQGRKQEALADAHRAEEASREALRFMAQGLSEDEALAFERIRSSGLDVMLEFANQVDDAERVRILDAVVRSRLVVLDELADENRALPRDDGRVEPQVRELEEARLALSRALVEGLRAGAAPDSSVAAAHRRREAAERALAERSAAFRLNAGRAHAGLESVRRALPEHGALVSFVRWRNPDQFIRESNTSPDARPQDSLGTPMVERYGALVLRAGDASPHFVSLGPASQLEPLIERWAEACATPPPADGTIARAAERRVLSLGRAVRRKLWDPLQASLAGAERIFVVPDGAVGRVNLLALPDERGVYLAEKKTIVHRLTAERDLVPWESAGKDSRGVLALGGADFQSALQAPPLWAVSPEPISTAAYRSAVADSIRIVFGALPETGTEASEVASLWRQWGGQAPGEVVQLVGPAASEEAFKQLAPGRRVLHLATHGFALGARASAVTPQENSRGVGQVSAEPATAIRRGGPLLTGLALAGANAPADSSHEDGFLTAEEITSLDLSGAEWAVLSACETGLSEPDQIEAVQGLHRAFRRAGLRTVIMSLWAVNDTATRDWMKSLYRARLLDRTDTATAVRSACRAQIESRRKRGLDTHPFYWAAFVAAGDWR